jgi:hypothetical protein
LSKQPIQVTCVGMQPCLRPCLIERVPLFLQDASKIHFPLIYIHVGQFRLTVQAVVSIVSTIKPLHEW